MAPQGVMPRMRKLDCCGRAQVAQETGILLDPIYSLAAWEVAKEMAGSGAGTSQRVVMLHSGGMMGLFGLAQRFPEQF